jgi:hypothetical protein
VTPPWGNNQKPPWSLHPVGSRGRQEFHSSAVLGHAWPFFAIVSVGDFLSFLLKRLVILDT